MAHQTQREFCEKVKQRFPDSFKKKRVLDVGSLDINGSNRDLFEDCQYTGIDIAPGKNVDLVVLAHELQAPDGSFDTVISTETFEHDQYYEKSLKNIVRVLRPSGIFVFTCATTGRPEHGTRRNHPGSSPLTVARSTWQDYYRNLTVEDICEALNIALTFTEYELSARNGDMFFFGVKRSFCKFIGILSKKATQQKISDLLIGIPVLNRPDLLRRALASLDTAADILIINNSIDPMIRAQIQEIADEFGALTCPQDRNIGVAASWNVICRHGIQHDYSRILITANDVVFKPGVIKQALEEVDRIGAVIHLLLDFNAFILTKETIDAVGWFDECFYPAYKEDQDYEYRCRLAGVKLARIPGLLIEHDGSMTIKSDRRYAKANENTHFNWNRNHYICKWGGDAGCERFTHPYNEQAFDWRYWPDPSDTLDVRDWR